jgi:murein L,D-transpeptidase YcbB/YkuD
MSLLRRTFLLALLLTGPISATAADPSAFELAFRDRAKAVLAAEEPLMVAGTSVDPGPVRRFYELRDFTPAWVGHDDRTAELTAVLATAGEEGIDLALPARSGAATSDPGAAFERDLSLTSLALRYAGALAAGRVRPEQWEEDWAVPQPNFDPVAGLDRALKAGRLEKWFVSLTPGDGRYLRLRAALVHYRELQRTGGWAKIPAGPPLKPGMTDDRIPTLRQRLAAEGDLPEGSLADNTDNTYDNIVEQGVRAFQRRHGIVIDGAVGPRTLAALNVGVAARIAQIELNLERWRSLPRELGRNYVFINVPAESVEVVENNAPVMTMKAVVGDPDHPTPVVQASIAALTFNPVWNVPTSIAMKEIRPKAQRDPKYLARNQIIALGTYSFQQRPGPLNPLGQIKFETPNKFDVYLHDTPSKNAFERAARAMSHGCVRLEHARDLATYVLDPSIWTSESIDAALALGSTQKVDIKRHLRVHFFYFTSFVDADGTIEFRDDIYGRDKRLALALQAQEAARLSVAPGPAKDRGRLG